MLRSDRHLSCFKQIFVSTVSNFCLKNYCLLKDSFFLGFSLFYPGAERGLQASFTEKNCLW